MGIKLKNKTLVFLESEQENDFERVSRMGKVYDLNICTIVSKSKGGIVSFAIIEDDRTVYPVEPPFKVWVYYEGDNYWNFLKHVLHQENLFREIDKINFLNALGRHITYVWARRKAWTLN